MKPNGTGKHIVGLKSYPRVYFELVLVGFILVMGMSLSAAFLPIFANDLDPSGVLVGFVVSAWFFSRIFMELPSGVLSDRLGRRKLLVIGLGLATVGALMCSLASSVYLLIVGRALWGLGTALFFMSNTALILDLVEPSARGRALGTFQGMEFIGSFMGAPIGGFMAGIIGYRQVFTLAFILILGSFSVAFISKGLRQVRVETNRESNLPLREVLSSVGSWGLTVTYVNSFSRMFIMQGVKSTVLPLYLNHELSISVELIGIIMGLRTLGHIVATVSSGHFSDRLGRKPMIILGLAVEGISLYLYSRLPFLEPLLFVGFLEGFGGGMILTSLIVLLYEGTPTGLKGGGLGMYRTFMDVGGFVGPPVFMLIFSSMGSYAAFLFATAILALNVVLVAIPKRKRTSV